MQKLLPGGLVVPHLEQRIGLPELAKRRFIYHLTAGEHYQHFVNSENLWLRGLVTGFLPLLAMCGSRFLHRMISAEPSPVPMVIRKNRAPLAASRWAQLGGRCVR
jgi:hypothetical protein